MKRWILAALAFAPTACASPPPPPDNGPQTAALLACVKHNTRGWVADGYIINSVGDPATVKRMFDEIIRDWTPDTFVGGIPGWSWAVVESHQKNATPLPMPTTCGPPPNSN